MTTALQRAPRLGLRMLYSPRAWRRWFRHASSGIRDRHAERTFGQIAPYVPAGSRVVDLGAYDGRLGRLLHERAACGVELVDIVDHNVTSLPFHRYDGRTVPLADGSCDVVIAMYVLHHAKDDLQLLREMRRIVAPGGRVLIAEDLVDRFAQRAITIGFHIWLATFTFMGWSRFRTTAAWRDRFTAAGLSLDPGSYGVVSLGAAGPLWPRNVLYVLRPR